MTQDAAKIVRGQDLFCPRDGDGMEEKHMGSAFLDGCRTCGGQFFDAGEMFAVFGIKADPSYWDRHETGGVLRDGTIICPRCKNATMLKQDVQHGSEHVEIDRCRACNGIWLDGGEVQTIMKISESMAPVIEAEKARARQDLAAVGEVDLRATGLIGRFFAMFTKPA